MTILPPADRAAISADFQQKISDEREAIAVNKTNLALAITAIAQWVDDNQTSFNSAIPQPARSALTQRQKIRLLKLVLDRTFEVTP